MATAHDGRMARKHDGTTLGLRHATHLSHTALSIMAADETFTPRDPRHPGRGGAPPHWSIRARCSPGWPPMCRASPAARPVSCSARCRCSATASQPQAVRRQVRRRRDSTRASITDLSLLEPNNLITPNELAYIRTEIPAAAAEATQGPWTLDTSGLLAPPAIAQARRSADAARRRWARISSSVRATATNRRTSA